MSNVNRFVCFFVLQISMRKMQEVLGCVLQTANLPFVWFELSSLYLFGFFIELLSVSVFKRQALLGLGMGSLVLCELVH